MSRYDLGSALIGFPHGDRVTIRVIRREYSQLDEDDWDADWVATPIAVRAGAFRADVDAAIRADRLRAFRVGLQDLYASLRGEARLESEDWVDLRVVWAGSDGMFVEGELLDGGNRLCFRIDGFDQTHLPELIRSLERLEAALPAGSLAS